MKMMAPMTLIGKRIRVMMRTRSTQKLPRVLDRARVRPRMRATATAMPAAAEVNISTTRPAIWVNWDMVSSPA